LKKYHTIIEKILPSSLKSSRRKTFTDFILIGRPLLLHFFSLRDHFCNYHADAKRISQKSRRAEMNRRMAAIEQENAQLRQTQLETEAQNVERDQHMLAIKAEITKLKEKQNKTESEKEKTRDNTPDTWEHVWDNA
jgi:hypothetical protein